MRFRLTDAALGPFVGFILDSRADWFVVVWPPNCGHPRICHRSELSPY